MNKNKSFKVRFSFVLVIIFLMPTLLVAATHYVRSGATGAATGADWANACTDFAGSCAVPSLKRGDTYYVADGVYFARKFNTPAAGTQTITIKKATKTDHGIETGWAAEYGDGQATFAGTIYFASDFWVFDGQSRSSLTSGHGFLIDKKANPDNFAGIYVGDPYVGQGGTVARNVTLQFFEVKGSGDRSDPKLYVDHGVQAALVNRISDIRISSFYIHDSGGVGFKIENAGNVIIENGYVTRNHSTSGGHSEGIAARSIDTFTVRYNWFVDLEGTAHLTTPGGSAGIGSNWYIYGNVFMRTPGNPYNISNVGNGAIYFLDTQISGDVYIYNNTVFNMTAMGDNGGIGMFSLNRTGNALGNVKVQNNLWYSSASPYSTCDSCVTFDWSYNSYFDITWSTTDPDTEKQVSTGSPFIDAQSSNFHPTSTVNAGNALPTPFDFDLEGRLRGSTGRWARGALEYASTIVGAPTNLRATSR